MGIEVINGNAASYQGTVESAGAKPESTGATVSEEVIHKKAAEPQVTEKAERYTQSGEEGYGSTLANEDLNLLQKTNNTQMKKAVEEINRRAHNTEAVFGIHDDTNRVTIKIVDKDSKEVIKEYPPEKTLDMIAKVWEMAGLMVDQKL